MMLQSKMLAMSLILALIAGVASATEGNSGDLLEVPLLRPVVIDPESGAQPVDDTVTEGAAEDEIADIGSASRLRLQQRLLGLIGEDLQALGAEFAIDELNHLARYSLEIERPDLFRTVMVSQVDEHWAGLSDARTALNMIAWLPDTADNLAPRITAARLAISAGELPDLEAQRLWRDLRARVERVGDPALLFALASSMIEAGSSELLVDTINRFHSTDRKRLETFVALLEAHGRSASPEISTHLYEAIVAIGGANAGGDRSAPGIARALWSTGRTEEAFLVLFLEPDPLVRLRTRFELLAQEPPVE